MCCLVVVVNVFFCFVCVCVSSCACLWFVWLFVVFFSLCDVAVVVFCLLCAVLACCVAFFLFVCFLGGSESPHLTAVDLIN